MNTVFKTLMKAIGIMGYFIVLNFAYTRMNLERLTNDIEVFSGIFLVLGLVMLERAYKKEDGKLAISGIELLVLSMHSLSINHVIAFYQYDFRFYLLTSSYVFAIYYVLKSIIIYTKEKRQYLKNLSDISEIVKEEPIKKEAKKRKREKNNNVKQQSKENINKKLEKIEEPEKIEKKESVKKEKVEKEKPKEETKKRTRKSSTKKQNEKTTKKVEEKETKTKKTKKEKQENKEEVKKEKNEEVKKGSKKKKKEVLKND